MKCGLLGKTLAHSYSPEIHSLLCDYSYELFEVDKEKLVKFMTSRDFDGINVTIPYKKAVIEYCDELDETARKIGSVNTIVNKGGRLFGYNTDFFGFMYMIKSSGIQIENKKVLVLGNGGASVTVQSVLRELKAEKIVVISRQGEDNYENISRHFDADIIVNATPVGMYPNTLVSPVDLSGFKSLSAVFDLIYNPARTQIILDAQRLGIPAFNGLPMLVAQAAKSCELFTDTEVSDKKIINVIKTLNTNSKNIFLVGMAGCGKTYIGQRLADMLGREFIDTDKVIEKRENTKVPEIFKKYGERYFRSLETEILREYCKKSGLVISGGGGAATIPENTDIIRQNSVVVWVKRNIDSLATDGRPLSQSGDLSKLYKKREPLYKGISDITVVNDETEAPIHKIKEKLYENSCY